MWTRHPGRSNVPKGILLMKRTRQACLTAICLMAAGALHADILILNEGNRLEGRVEATAPGRESVAYISATGRIELPKARIRELIEEPDSKDWTRVGEQFLKAKNYPMALQMFQKGVEADATFEEARKGLTEAQSAIEAQQAARVAAAQEAITKELELVPQMLEQEKYQGTLELLNRVLSGDSSTEQRVTAQRLMRDLYLAWGFSRYDRLDMAGAEENYQRVLEMDPDNREARDRLLMIWKNDPAKRPEVLRAYQAKLALEPNNLQLNQTVGDLLYREERWTDALEPLAKVAAAPRYVGQGYDSKLKRSYEMAITKASDEGKLDEAISLFQRLLSIFPNEDRTNLTVLTYERDKSRLAKDDYDGQALLVRKLYNDGLTQYGEREAELILRYDPENEIADSVLRKQAEELFQAIVQNMQAQEYLVARNLATRFVATEKRYADLIEKAQEFSQKADIEVQKQQRANRESALRLAENGMQAYNEALRYVDMMQDTQRRTDSRVVSPKGEAIKNARRAIERFDTALQLDPTLGPSTGMDLSARRRDAQQLLNSLTDRATPLPKSRKGTSR